MYKQTLKAIMTLFLAGSATIGSAANDTMPLHSGWKFRQAGHSEWHPATVPGVVHTDLMDNGLIEDPYYRLNERSLQWIDKEDWIYEVSFDAGALMRGYEHIRLEFLGLDTYADVFLNETQILTADNMFRRWRTEVKRLLRPGENTLKVYFHSPIKVDLPKYDSLPYRYEAINDQSANGGLFDKRVSIFARKAGYHYGWDWGPQLPDMGLFRPVQLVTYHDAEIRDVWVRQKHENRADKWAIQTLIPRDALDSAVAGGCTDLWSLAEHFSVTEELMRKAVCWYTYGNLNADLYF